ISNHDLVLVCLPSSMYSITSAAFTATRLLSSFHSVQFAWMVSIEVGIPNINADIRLVMLVQYDCGKATNHGFQRIGMPDNPAQFLLQALSKLDANHFN
ncbi:hypothetical protein BO86DRAFT_315258, partial [Aspergillus japonicus CBS 114.51]